MGALPTYTVPGEGSHTMVGVIDERALLDEILFHIQNYVSAPPPLLRKTWHRFLVIISLSLIELLGYSS